MLNDLYTPRGENLTGTPWTCYPRPQLRRDSYINLNGWWDFAVTEAGLPRSYFKKIQVPFCPESPLSGIHEHFAEGSTLCYRRTFALPEGFNRGRVLLHIGAADQTAEVFVNKQRLCRHVGGYEAFTVDITDALAAEENELEICVQDSLKNHVLPYGKQTLKRGGMWYTPVSGIWQTVWLESVPETYMEKLTILNRDDSVTIDIGMDIPGTVTVAGLGEFPLEAGQVTITPEEPHFWSPEDPYLYEFVVEAGDDRVESYFALRILDIRRVKGVPRLCLNGQPYFFHGLLDQGYWPDGLFTPADPECYTDDILAMKKLGFNTLRKHIKVEPEEFYYQCDKLGMVVFQDMVNNGEYRYVRDTVMPTLSLRAQKSRDDTDYHRNEATRKAFLSGMKATVNQLKNHPSIFYWTIFNEGWGQFDSDGAYRRLRRLDDTRWIDTTSGWFRREKTDVDSRHVYFRKIDLKGEGKPLVLSEFGGFSHKVEGHVFHSGKEYGYGACDSLEDFSEAVTRVYREQVIPSAQKGLCAAIYTQVSDVEDEINGLVTYDRKVEKLDPEKMLPLAAALQKAVGRISQDGDAGGKEDTENTAEKPKLSQTIKKYAFPGFSFALTLMAALFWVALRINYSGISKFLGADTNQSFLIMNLPLMVCALAWLGFLLALAGVAGWKKRKWPAILGLVIGVTVTVGAGVVVWFGARDYLRFILGHFWVSLAVSAGLTVFALVLFCPAVNSRKNLVLKWTLTILAVLGAVVLGYEWKPCTFTYGAVVYAVEDDYQIVFSTSDSAMAWVEIGGESYYDLYAGSMRSADKVHKVEVPQEVLDAAGGYTVCAQQMIYRGPFGGYTGPKLSQKYDFRPVDASNGLNYYAMSDVHEAVDAAVRTASYSFNADHELDFLVLLGDIVSMVETEADAQMANELAYGVTKGEIPVIYARGNHEIKGEYAEVLYKYVGSKNQDFYYTVTLGEEVFAVVMDLGEDHEDDWWEYYGTAKFDLYRQEQTEMLEAILAEGAYEAYPYHMAICHIPITYVEEDGLFEPFRLEWTALLNEMDIDICLGGHLHKLWQLLPGAVEPYTDLTYAFDYVLDSGKGPGGYLTDFNFPTFLVGRRSLKQTGGTQKLGFSEYICLHTSVDFAQMRQVSCYVNSTPEIVTGYYPFEGNYDIKSFQHISTNLKSGEEPLASSEEVG